VAPHKTGGTQNRWHKTGGTRFFSSSANLPDAIGLKRDLAFFVQLAQSRFEVLFAHLEPGTTMSLN
jgi:hypothetical protein